MEHAKTIIIFFLIVSIIIFIVTHGATWLKDNGISTLSSAVSILKFDLPVPK